MKLKDIKNWYVACTGNTCRSPLLQRILLEKLANEKVKDAKVNSRMALVKSNAGKGLISDDIVAFYSINPGPVQISQASADIILHVFDDKEFVMNHTAKSFIPKELDDADIVITMEGHHKATLTKYVEAFSKDKKCKVYTLGELVGRPDEKVQDPISMDYCAFLDTYDGETGGSLSEELEEVKATRPDRVCQVMEQHQRIIDNHFSDERQMTIRLSAYMPTFNQMDGMVNELFEKQEIEFDTIEELFASEIIKSYDYWARFNNPESTETIEITGKEFSLVRSKKPTVLEQREIRKTYNSLCELVYAYQTAAKAGNHPQLEELYGSFSSSINTNVTKLFKTIKEKENKTKNTLIAKKKNYQKKIGVALGPHFINLADNLIEFMSASDREGAFELRKLAHHVAGFAEDFCSYDTVDRIYAGFTSKKLMLAENHVTH